MAERSPICSRRTVTPQCKSNNDKTFKFHGIPIQNCHDQTTSIPVCEHRVRSQLGTDASCPIPETSYQTTWKSYKRQHSPTNTLHPLGRVSFGNYSGSFSTTWTKLATHVLVMSQNTTPNPAARTLDTLSQVWSSFPSTSAELIRVEA